MGTPSVFPIFTKSEGVGVGGVVTLSDESVQLADDVLVIAFSDGARIVNLPADLDVQLGDQDYNVSLSDQDLSVEVPDAPIVEICV